MKRLYVLILVLLMVAPTALGQQDIYQKVLDMGKGALVEVPAFDPETTYTFHIPARRVASKEYFEKNALTPDKDLGLAGETEQEQVPGSELGKELLTQKRDIYPISTSPDGQTLLMGEKENLLLKKGGDLYVLPLNIERGDDAELATYHVRKDADTRIGTEGVVWSPDGRYIAFPNASANAGSDGNWPLLLADTLNNELFTVKNYHGPIGGKLNACAQTVFSPDSAWLYYTENVDGILRLCRYNMEQNTHELLLDTKESYSGTPGIGWDSRGRLLCALTHQGKGFLAAFRQKEGVYSPLYTEPLADGVLPHFVQRAGDVTMAKVSGLSPNEAMPFTYIIRGKALTASADAQGQIVFECNAPLYNPEDMQAFRDSQAAAPSNAFIHSLALKPDGRYALAIVLAGETPSLHLVDIQTLRSAVLSVDEESAKLIPALQAYRYSYGLTWYAQDDLFSAPFMDFVKQFRIQAQ